MKNINFYRREKSNSHFKAHRETFFIFLMFCMTIFNVNLALAVTQQDLISYHSFDQSSTSTVLNNVSGSGTTLEVTNSDWAWVPGKLGNSINITGNSGGVVRLNFTDLTDYQVGSNDFTMNFWFRANADGGANDDPELWIIRNPSISVPDPLRIQNIGTSNNFRWGDTINPGNYVNNRVWKMATAIKNGSSCSLYLNGTLTHVDDCTGEDWSTIAHINFGNDLINPDFEGSIAFDEAGFWMRALDQGDIDDLWNNGNAIDYADIEETVKLNLISPANNTDISTNGTNFHVSGTVTPDFNLTNITYFVWDDSGLFNETTVTNYTNNQTFSNTLFIDSFIQGDYEWGSEICYENSTFNDCLTSVNNSFSVEDVSVVSEEYESPIIEGSLNTFSLNVSTFEGFRITTIDLIYNETLYNTNLNEYKDNFYRSTVSLDTPLVSTNENVNFFWNITLDNGEFRNTSVNTQTITNLIIDDCSSGTEVLFNYTLYDEDTKNFLDGTSENTSISLDLNFYKTDGTIIPSINFSQEYDEVNPALVCANSDLGNSEFRIFSVAEYSSTNRFSEFYNIQNYLLTSSTDEVNISLYNLNSSRGEAFNIIYKGEDFVPSENTVVQIQRKYIADGIFRTVEVPSTGGDGIAVGHLIPNDVIYNLVFIQNGTVLDTFSNIVAKCQNPSISECQINLNAFISGDNLFDLINEDDFFSSLSFNRDTMTVSSVFGITSSVPGEVILNVTQFDNRGNINVCSDSLTSTTGTLSCVVPQTYDNTTVRAIITLNGDIRREGFINLNPTPQEQYGGILIFVSLTVVLFLLGLVAVSDSPAITGFGLILGVVVLGGLNLIYSDSWIGQGATVLFFIVAIIVIVVKAGARR